MTRTELVDVKKAVDEVSDVVSKFLNVEDKKSMREFYRLIENPMQCVNDHSHNSLADRFF